MSTEFKISITGVKKKVKIYLNDSSSLILDKIAYGIFKTTSKYIKVIEGDFIDFNVENKPVGGTIKVLDLYTIVKDNLTKYPRPNKLYNYVISKGFSIDKRDFGLWMYNQLEKDIDDFDRYEQKYKILIHIDYKSWLKRYTDELNSIKDNIEKSENLFEGIEPINATKLVYDSIKMRYTLSNFNFDGVFDVIVCDKELPFIRLKSFYKLWKGKISNPSIIEKVANINVQDYDQVLYLILNMEDFSQVIKIYTESGSDQTYLEYTVERGGEKEKNIETLQKYIGDELKIIRSDTFNVKGIFGIPEFIFNKPYIADFFTNSDIIGKLFIPIERKGKGRKTKVNPMIADNLKMTYDLGRAKVYMEQKVSTPGDYLTIAANIPHYTGYLNIRISKTDKYNINLIKYTLMVLLSKYVKEEEKIFKKYRKFLGDSTPKIVTYKEFARKHFDKLQELKKQIPSLFESTGYPKMCKSDQQPKYRDLEEAKKLGVREGEYIKRIPPPKEGAGGTIFNYPKDSEHWFECSNPPYVNANLKEIKDAELKKIYPYFPCCYKTEARKGSNIINYYADTKVVSSGGDKLYRSKVYRGAEENNHEGVLPPVIQNYFNNIWPNTEWGRVGSPYTTSSLLHCVLKGLGDETYLVKTMKSQKQYIEKLRIKTLSKENLDFLITETPELNRFERIEELKDTKIFLDWRRWGRLIELYFKVNIIVFNTESFDYPNFSQPMLLSGKYHENKTIAVIRSETEAKNNVYELIQKRASEEPYILTTAEADSLYSLYMNTYTIYTPTLSTPVDEYAGVIINYFRGIGADIKQYADNDGKIHMLVINEEFPINIRPVNGIPNISLFISTWEDIPFPKNSRELKKLAEKYKVETSKDKQIKLHNIIIDDLEVGRMYTKDFFKGDSIYDLINNKRIATILRQYILWLWNDSNRKYNSIEQFLDDNTVIDTNKYYDISRIENKFTKNSILFNNEGKLILNSVKLRDKASNVIKYYGNKKMDSFTIKSYYQNTTDFTTNEDSNNIVFNSKYQVNAWLNKKDMFKLDINIVPDFSLINSYILEIENMKYFIQNVYENNKERAITVAKIWNRDKRNIGYQAAPWTGDTKYNYYTINDKTGWIYEETSGATLTLLTYRNMWAAILPIPSAPKETKEE